MFDDFEKLGYFKYQKGIDDNLIIAFSSVHTPKNKFRFSRAFLKGTSHVIYVNCERNSFYLEGIPGLGSSIEKTASTLTSIIEKISVRNVIAVGSSMGAFGAVLYGSLMNLQFILAGCTNLDPRKAKNLPRDLVDIAVSQNLVQKLRDYNGEAVLYYGLDCLQDISFASNAFSLGKNNVSVYGIPKENHGVLESLAFSYDLNDLVQGIFQRKQHDLLEQVDVIYDSAEVEELASCELMMSKGELSENEIDKLLVMVASSIHKYCKWNAAFILSVYFLKRGDKISALLFSKIVMSLNSISPKCLSHHLRILYMEKKYEKVVAFEPNIKHMVNSIPRKLLLSSRSKKRWECLVFLAKAAQKLENIELVDDILEVYSGFVKDEKLSGMMMTMQKNRIG